MTKRNPTQVTAEPGKQELYVTREFEAPRELVFKAFTERDLYAQWLGPRGYEMEVQTFEPRDGGAWQFTHKDQNGNVYGFHGVYHEVTAPGRIIGTFEFEGLPERGHVLLETTRFEDLPGGRTRVIAHDVYQSVEDRDGMLQSGMESGMVDSYERLDELLEKAQVQR